MVSIQFESTGLSTDLDAINKNLMYLYYHLKCQDITDKVGDIKLEVMKSSQNTVISYNLVKWCQFNSIQQDCQLIKCNQQKFDVPLLSPEMSGYY